MHRLEKRSTRCSGHPEPNEFDRKEMNTMRFLNQKRGVARNRGAKLAAGGLSVIVGLLAFASVSVAAPHHPKGEYAQFGDCPLSRATLTDCIYSVTNGGSFVLGKKTVPIVNPVTLQGGFEGAGSEISFFGAEDGNTLSKTPQPVPGGLLGITAPTWWPKSLQEWFNKGISEGFTGVNATVELAQPATSIKLNTENLIFEEGVALQLPVKFHLENSLLGSSCYIGSNSNPVIIPFTTGQSGKLHGAAGEVSFNAPGTITTISGGKLVNNTYAAPGATGCGGFLIEYLLDPLVNSIVGVPSASGTNSATLQGKLQDAAALAVRESEK
jgi:hypothetical protein